MARHGERDNPNKAKSNNGAILGFEEKLWQAADELRAHSKLKSSEYSVPVLGLIFLRYADHKFTHVEKELAAKSIGWRRKIGKTDYQACGVMYLPEGARFANLPILIQELERRMRQRTMNESLFTGWWPMLQEKGDT